MFSFDGAYGSMDLYKSKRQGTDKNGQEKHS